jgi:hypothetical protein
MRSKMMLERPTSSLHDGSSSSNLPSKATRMCVMVHSTTFPFRGSSLRGSIRDTRTCVPLLKIAQLDSHNNYIYTHSNLWSGRTTPGPTINDATGRPNCVFSIQKAAIPVKQYPSSFRRARLQFDSRFLSLASSSSCSASSKGKNLLTE